MNQEQIAFPASVLVIMAHPDDLEFMVGGTVARWIIQGATVHLLLATRGEAGNERHPQWSSREVARVREDEQRAAQELLGIAGITYLEEPDGELVASTGLRRRLVQEIRQLRPEAVILPDPTLYYRETHVNHPDHRAIGEAALAAVFPNAGNPMYHPELGAAHQLKQVWITMATQPNAWVDITDFLDKKLAAIACHTSQVGHVVELEHRIKAWAAHTDQSGKLTHREWFRLIDFHGA